MIISAEKILKFLSRKYIILFYYLGKIRLNDKIKEILKYDEDSVGYKRLGAIERALPGFQRYKKSGYYRLMIGRCLLMIRYLKNKEVLDSACGLGWCSYLISDFPKKLLSIDIDEPTIKLCKKLWKNEKLNFKKHSALEISKLNKKFETIIGLELIEHFSVEDSKKYLQETYRCLKEKGTLVLSSSFSSNVSTENTRENIYHLHIFTKKEIIGLLTKIGFSNFKFVGNNMLIAIK